MKDKLMEKIEQMLQKEAWFKNIEYMRLDVILFILTLLTSEVENTLNKITDAINKKYPITFIEMKGGAEEGGYVVRGKQNSVDISRLSPDEYHMIDFIDSIISEQRKALSDIGGGK